MNPPDLPIRLPSDDELYAAFVDAIKNGVHEGIRDTVSKLTGFIANAKDEIKNLIIVDTQRGLLLEITIPKGDQMLAAFVGKQGFLMRNTLKIILLAEGISTFTNFVAKTKANPQSLQTTSDTLSKIMVLFFANLGKNYLTSETEATIKPKITALFA